MKNRRRKQEPIDPLIVSTAIVCLTLLEVAAMYHGINGKFFATIVAAIAGLAGLSLPQIKIKSFVRR